MGKLPELRIGDLTVRLPIIQGGMGVGVSMAGLASAVAEAGGVGVIATACMGWGEDDVSTDYVEANNRALRKQIRLARERTGGVLGVNIMVALTNYEELVRTAVDEGIDMIISGAGLPMALPGLVDKTSKTKLVPIVSSARAATVLCKKWQAKHGRLPDAVVVEGPKAGGHLGFKAEQIDDPEYALENLVPAVVSAVAPFAAQAGRSIPVIAAGGVYTGEDINRMLELGASGVQMGTRFVATHECDAATEFKQAYVDATPEDLTIIKSPVGMPGRALRNEFIRSMEAGGRTPKACAFHCIHTCDHTKSPYCIATALLNARRGALKHGLVFAGANAHRVKAVVSVQELMDELIHEYGRCRSGGDHPAACTSAAG
jgi:nitronate monooxygenase